MPALFLLAISYGLLVCIAYQRGAKFRAALLIAAVVWGVLVVAQTELLSAFQALSSRAILTGWSTIIVVLTLVAGDLRATLRQWIALLGNTWSGTTLDDRLLLGAVAVIFLIGGFLGISSAPANFESLAYHLPRVMHWLQNHSLANYNTAFSHQIYQPPWTEFVITQLQALSDNDRYFFVVSWTGSLLAIVGVSLIAQRLGADAHGQIVAVVVAATLPAIVLQLASSTNNVSVGFWLVCMAYFALEIAQSTSRPPVMLCAGFGAALGLAVLTKGTAYAIGLPMVIWLGVMMIRRAGLRGIVLGAFAASIVVVLNVGHWSRNFRQYHSPMGPATEMTSYRNDLRTWQAPQLFIVNVAKNLGSELTTPSPALNRRIEKSVLGIHRMLGIAADDSRITYSSYGNFGLLPFDLIEDTSSNPAHLVLLGCVGIGILCTGGKDFKRRGSFPWLLAAFAGSLSYCAIISWQPWCGRLHLPLFLLGSVAAGVFLVGSFPKAFSSVICLLLLILALPYCLWNQDHPLVSGPNKPSILFTTRESQYFLDWDPDYASGYGQMADLLASRHVNTIGMVGCYWHLEYPLWALLHDRLGYWPQIESLDNRSPNRWQWHYPDAIVLFRPDLLTLYVSYFSTRWDCEIVNCGQFTVLLPQEPFSGFGILDGLKSIEGPYPGWKLPVVRWGTTPQTKLDVYASCPCLRELKVSAHTGVEQQSISVLLNGKPIAVWPLAADNVSRFATFQCDLPLVAGQNIVEMRYSQPLANTAPQNAVLFRSIHVFQKPN